MDGTLAMILAELYRKNGYKIEIDAPAATAAANTMDTLLARLEFDSQYTAQLTFSAREEWRRIVVAPYMTDADHIIKECGGSEALISALLDARIAWMRAIFPSPNVYFQDIDYLFMCDHFEPQMIAPVPMSRHLPSKNVVLSNIGRYERLPDNSRAVLGNGLRNLSLLRCKMVCEGTFLSFDLWASRNRSEFSAFALENDAIATQPAELTGDTVLFNCNIWARDVASMIHHIIFARRKYSNFIFCTNTGLQMRETDGVIMLEYTPPAQGAGGDGDNAPCITIFKRMDE
jgi:hypothetical protein